MNMMFQDFKVFYTGLPPFTRYFMTGLITISLLTTLKVVQF
jgi:hypothetical protein